ncbi:lipocalin family protein [Dyadobacter psychrotolerans]|uniref:Lipocalin-like domain-containing protein n=1 Tax=Dyadobacter psychrotolerans TaxID=2541721 RepID=A0A4R5DI52_9BACT|nr:lipocalin family protein [Dyadobacter psychrotolerans]TDE13782.1 hypothetical protein E0F88_17965 [Dyadobacter psychrotolerans]
MKNIILLIVQVSMLIFVSACKSNDPSSKSLVGSWDVIAYKTHPDSTLKEPYKSSRINVIFDRKGKLGSVGITPFDGGWCNVAERYSIDKDIISFQFGKPNCIPLINPNTPESAKIIELTGNTLTIEWGQSLLKMDRR